MILHVAYHFQFLLVVVVFVLALLLSVATCRPQHHPLKNGFDWTTTNSATFSAAASNTHVDPKSEMMMIRSILNDITSASFSSSLRQQRMVTTTTSTTSTTSHSLDYTIFRHGKSALRNMPLQQCEWIERFGKSVAALLLLALHEKSLQVSSSSESSSSSSSSSLLLDLAHEVVLGVQRDNIDEAEYAATHPGQTNWMQNHPLSDVDDWIHSIIHRREGHAIGEGNHTGWDNAKYWAAGGPKQLYSTSSSTTSDDHDDAMNMENGSSSVAATGGASCNNGIMQQQQHHLIAQELARLALQRTPLCVKAGVVTKCPTQHYILAGGGNNSGQQKKRIVSIPVNCWDPFCFINLLSSSSSSSLQQEQELREELNILLKAEFDLLLKHAISRITTTDMVHPE